jgi:hypothetical protein
MNRCKVSPYLRLATDQPFVNTWNSYSAENKLSICDVTVYAAPSARTYHCRHEFRVIHSETLVFNSLWFILIHLGGVLMELKNGGGRWRKGHRVPPRCRLVSDLEHSAQLPDWLRKWDIHVQRNRQFCPATESTLTSERWWCLS